VPNYYTYQCYYKEEAFRPANWSLVSGSGTANGDELIITNGSFERVFPVTINQTQFDTLYIKSHGVNVGDSITYQILNSSNTILFQTVIYPLPQYSVYSTSISFSGTAYKHRFTSAQNVAIDFVAFVKSSNVLSYEGTVLETKIEKKTVVLRVPFASDAVQALGVHTPSYTLSYARVPKSVYDWFETCMANAIGILCITPVSSFTGYVYSVEGRREPGTDLYNVDVEIWKGDVEVF